MIGSRGINIVGIVLDIQGTLLEYMWPIYRQFQIKHINPLIIMFLNKALNLVLHGNE